jgi:voltage-gated potassium channel
VVAATLSGGRRIGSVTLDDIEQADPPPASMSALGVAQKEAPPRHSSMQMERDYLRALVSSEFRPVLGMVAITLSVGTIFYRIVEGWSVLDALYFSVVTLATIGFGDLSPATRIGKIFTIFYVFVGVGTLGLFLSTVARTSMRRSLEAQRIAMRRPVTPADDHDAFDEVTGKDGR